MRRGETTPPCSATTSSTSSTTTTRPCDSPSPPRQVAPHPSSHLGFVNSKDDFYVNGFGIGAMETTNAIYDETLYKHCTTDTVPSFIVAAEERCNR